MSWLARLEVYQETVRKEGIFDNYAWHKKLWDCFPSEPDGKRDFLTRIDQVNNIFRAWILTSRKPMRPAWCLAEDFALKEISPSFLAHRYYAFDLRANPVKALIEKDDDGKPIVGPNGKWKRGKRVPLVKSDELRAWLIRKGEVRCRDNTTGLNVPGGFRIVENKPLDISPVSDHYFRKKAQLGCHGGVQFRGTLEVTDRERFIETYRSGLGGAKGFGFGLLLLAPASS